MELEEALATMLDIVKSVNDSMHQIAITGFEVCAGDKVTHWREAGVVSRKH